jgi:hypothetical protein
MFCELEHILRTHGDHEVLSDQSCLRDMIIDMRRLAADLGLDFQSALTRAEVENEPCLTHAPFDPRI